MLVAGTLSFETVQGTNKLLRATIHCSLLCFVLAHLDIDPSSE
jgi:hypothetical protein